MEVKKLYEDALKNHYAVGAFNFANIETLNSIICASEKTNKPVLACVSEGAMEYLGEFLPGIIESVKKNHKNIYFHLDHGKSFETIKKAVEMGFDSVMIDGSSLPFEENVKLTKKVCDYAHMHGVQVEGELGVLKGVEDNVSSDVNIYSDPKQCKEFVEKTNVDSLAIAIGTSHGAYKFVGESRLEFDILEKIQNLLGDFPLVLHGASSVYSEDVELFNEVYGNLKNANGLSDELIKKVAKTTNIVKINTDTDLRICYLANLKKSIFENKGEIDLRKHSKYAMQKLTERICHKINVLN